jgi:hypothetical protein
MHKPLSVTGEEVGYRPVENRVLFTLKDAFLFNAQDFRSGAAIEVHPGIANSVGISGRI